jgi:osmoprotectant transport system ATP-binding protein
VTHDLLEALALGTRIAVLDSGRLEVMTTPDDFLNVQTPTALSFLNTLPPQLLAERGRWQT